MSQSIALLDPTPATGIAPPPAFHIMLKPRGAICNLDCHYCYFLSKEFMYPDSDFHMSESMLEEYTRQYIEAQQVPEVTFAWQGGEPTLMGLDFFKKAVEFQQKHKKPGMRVENALQTNGTLLDDEWCEFLHRSDFLIGLSMDGPRKLHDFYRVDKGGQPTWEKVMRAARMLHKHKVRYNILTTVHAANAPHPLEVYRFLRDEVKTEFMQFIPIVERDNDTGYQEGNTVKDRSVTAEQYGDFLIQISRSGCGAMWGRSSCRSSTWRWPDTQDTGPGCVFSRRRAVQRWRWSTTAICSPATTTWNRTTCWATSRRSR